jgi:phospholipase A1/A2
MKTMPEHTGACGLRRALGAGGLLLIWPGFAAALAPGLPESAAGPALGLARCARIDGPEQRLACFDALAARADGPTPRVQEVDGTADPDPDADSGSVEQRLADADEAEAVSQRRRFFGILPYRPNYVLPVAYNSNPNPNLEEQATVDLPLFSEGAFDNVEIKFQLSFEVPLWTNIANRPLDLYFAYSQLAFFQAYNREYSSPFRETNYEPEVGFHWEPGWRIGTGDSRWRLTSVRAAANHQSNGRSEPLSRGWNRFIGQATVERDDLSLGVRLWSLLGANPSDNPDIKDYLGFGELHAGYDLGRHRLGVMLRSPEHPTVQLDWSWPVGGRIRLYAQYFNGYGESLLDYDHSVNRIGVGFMLAD